MIILVIMEIRLKVDGEVSGFEYSFFSYVIKVYGGQDHVQVADVIQLVVDALQDRQPAANKVIIQSDNASNFPHNNIFRSFSI